MRHIGSVVVVVLLLAVRTAGATEIDGRWGLGAGLFNGGGEVSLIRGVSARTAWLLDASVQQNESSVESDQGLGPTEAVQSGGSFSLGPRFRRFTRPQSEFSPYWDVYAHADYSRAHEALAADRITNETAGVSAGLEIGLEYFTRWHFSVAAHSGLLSFGWEHVRTEATSAVTAGEITGHTEFARLALNPVLFLRGYF